ncbi:L,D-transpeptidase family protein [Pseudomonas sp. gcc21]|uniref:L,D-transpeptidase family protein n=1 Tax=Pseudomonas sp. gcc21 TaxID=2726989 RepID=UPI0014526D9C|nr:L,D-transpeptidase family protein [Pseudomonas sp. gcc21]QJD58623.1 L,D-transpeptidase family protein [Pseudomonas sp. gcc21]
MFKKCTVFCLTSLLGVAGPLQADLPPADAVRNAMELPVRPFAEGCTGLAALRTLDIHGALGALYKYSDYRPIWKTSRRMDVLRSELTDLSKDGLIPTEYAYALHARASKDLCDDLRISSEYLLALEHLRHGRFVQNSHEPVWFAPGQPPNLSPGLIELAAAAVDDPAEAFNRARPAMRLYRQLRAAYAELPAQSVDLLPLPAGPTIKPDKDDPRLPQLARHLISRGYLKEQPWQRISAQPLLYDDSLEQAVRAFQADHALEVDGLVGRQTLAALNITASDRRQQVRINLERLRWLSALKEDYAVLVNSAGGDVRLYRGDERVWASRVQVGTQSRQTPLLVSRINRLTLNPSWTIPPTILREDKLPQIRNDPEYLQAHGLQVLDYSGRHLNPLDIDWNNPRGIMLRMGPGPDNPLGRMVFRFPNPFAVYLHDTPSQHLFSRAARTLSSGCVRVESAGALADRLVAEMGEAQQRRVRQLLDRGQTYELAVPNGPQLILGYWTAEVNEDGRLTYLLDPYEMDSALIERFEEADRAATARLPAVEPDQLLYHQPLTDGDAERTLH